MVASLHSSFLKVPKSQRTSKIFHVFQPRVKHSAAFSQMTTGRRLQSLSVQSLWSSPGFRQTAAASLWLSLGAPVTPVKWAIKGNFLTRSARALKMQWAQSPWLALEAHSLFLSFPSVFFVPLSMIFLVFTPVLNKNHFYFPFHQRSFHFLKQKFPELNSLGFIYVFHYYTVKSVKCNFCIVSLSLRISVTIPCLLGSGLAPLVLIFCSFS